MSIRCPNCHFENLEDSHFCSRCATPLTPPEDISAIPTKTWERGSDELTRGTVFAGRYEVIEELGRGGMGKVYRVEDKKINEEVVLKFLKPEIEADRRTIERFGNELKLARRIIHKNVCRMYDLNEEKGTHYISMEYVPGEDLKKMVRMSKQMSVSTAVSIARQVCEGLAEAHRLGVVHRDLKSSNIMIDRGGNARILDFGIARSLEAKGLTGAGVMIGTPEYMSPEQAEGREADQRSDIYSLGVIIYEMVTGRVPFEGETPLSVAVKHKTEAVREPRKLNAAVPEELSRVIMKCLEKDRSKRYQSAEELLSVLNLIEKRVPGGELIFAEEREVKKIRVRSKKAALYGIMAAVFFIIIVIVLAGIYLPKKPTGTIESIAVLPFKNVNADPDIEYISDGITETIISKLTQLPNLRKVIARSSVFRYKGESIDPKVVGQELGVDALLVSQMSKRGEELSISVELIKVQDGSRIWGDRYLRKSSEVFKVEEEITSSITESLRLNLKGPQLERMAKRYTNDPDAFAAYTRGRFLWNKRTEDDLNSAIKYFQEAIRLDPNYALAYTGLSHSYLLLPEYGNYPPKEAYPKVRDAALRALELDSMLSEAHVSLAQISLRYDRDWEEAERRYKRAIELDPGNSTAHHWYAYDLMCRARFDEAIKEMKRAYELDPLSLIINRNLGQVYYRAGQYDKALEALQKTQEMDPNFSFVHYYLGLIYLQRSMYEEALAEFQTEKEKARGWATRAEAMIGIAYVKLGMKDKAQEILKELIVKSEQVYVQPTSIAILYFVMGENKQGFKWLDKAYDEYDSNLRLIKVDPFYERVRSDPRFKEMMKKAGVES